MLIEYKFKFEKNGLTVAEQIEPGISDSQRNRGCHEENLLRAAYQESEEAYAATGPQADSAVDQPQLRPLTPPSWLWDATNRLYLDPCHKLPMQ
jgi:hypothetical protein